MSAREPIAPEVGRILRTITGAMAAGIALCAVVIVVLHARSTASPDPGAVRLVNVMTTVAMGGALAGIIVSEALWRVLLRREGPLGARVQSAFIARLAAREAAAFFGLVAGILAANGGVLRVYPAYWANLVPAGLFFVFVATHWPSDAALADEVAAGLGA